MYDELCDENFKDFCNKICEELCEEISEEVSSDQCKEIVEIVVEGIVESSHDIYEIMSNEVLYETLNELYEEVNFEIFTYSDIKIEKDIMQEDVNYNNEDNEMECNV